MKNFDSIIIGGGLGGLVAGAKLSQEGKKVLLIEQHYIPGGCATTFRRKDYKIEVGLHETDGFRENDIKGEIFNDLGVNENVEFVRVPEFYRLINNRLDITIPDNVNKAIKVLVNKFPKEEKAIKNFFKVIYSIYREINRLPQEKWKLALLMPIFPVLFPYLAVCFGPFTRIASLLNPLFLLLHPNLIFWKYQDLGSFLDSITKNEDLKLCLAANLGYYHDDPYSMSLIYFSIPQAGFYNNGGYFIKGGSQKLSNYLAKLITDNGGEVLLGNTVNKIITDGNKAIGVKYKKTFEKKSLNKKVYANTIIANTAIPNVINLLPSENRIALKLKTQNLKKSCSILTIYIGFKKEIKDLGNKCYSTFIADDNIKNLHDMHETNKKDFNKKSFVFVDYSQIDSGLASKGKSVGAICTVDYLINWKNLDKEEYKKKKEEVAQIYFKKLEKLIPGITKEIEYYEVGTPKTIKRYTLNPGGSVYGFAQTPKQAGMYRIPNKSLIENLYFASAWTNPGGGFTGAILSGWFCAKKVLKKF